MTEGEHEVFALLWSRSPNQKTNVAKWTLKSLAAKLRVSPEEIEGSLLGLQDLNVLVVEPPERFVLVPESRCLCASPARPRPRATLSSPSYEVVSYSSVPGPPPGGRAPRARTHSVESSVPLSGRSFSTNPHSEGVMTKPLSAKDFLPAKGSLTGTIPDQSQVRNEVTMAREARRLVEYFRRQVVAGIRPIPIKPIPPRALHREFLEWQRDYGVDAETIERMIDRWVASNPKIKRAAWVEFCAKRETLRAEVVKSAPKEYSLDNWYGAEKEVDSARYSIDNWYK